MCTHLKAIVLPVALFLPFPITSLFISILPTLIQGREREIDKGMCVCVCVRQRERVRVGERDRRTGREGGCVCV